MAKKKKTKDVEKESPAEVKSKNPLDFFFKLGDWVTKGDPIRQQDFMYYMLWILFLAFAGMFVLNTYRFFTTFDSSYLIWALIGFAISSLQFFNLKNFYMMKKARKEMPKPEPGEDEHKIEDVKEMLGGFKK